MLDARDAPLLASFAVVVRTGSLTAAARELGVSKSAISQQLQALEARCGDRLLDRSTRRLRLTEPGEDVLRVAGRVEAELVGLQRALEVRREDPAGTLRIATTHDLAAELVAPVAAGLLVRHPGLRVEVVADDAPHDPIAAGYDLSVRLGTPRDSAYVMRKLGAFDEPLVAAPSLAARYADARSPRALAGAPWVRHALLAADTLTFHGPDGAHEEVRLSLRGQANTGYGLRALLLGGAGIGVLPSYQLEDALRTGALVRLCPGWSWKRVTLYALLPAGAVRPATRVMVDALAAHLRTSQEGR